MTTQTVSRQAAPRRNRLRRVARVAIFTLALLLLLALALYAASPTLLARLAPYLADRVGLQHLELDVHRPRLGSVHIDRVAAKGNGLELEAHDLRLGFRWWALLRGTVDSVRVGRLDVALTSSGEPAAAAPPRSGALLPAALPAHIDVEELTLRFPDTGFAGEGTAALSEAGLTVSLAGRQPDNASRLRLIASLSRDGDYRVRLAEQEGGQEFLTLSGELAGDTLPIVGRFDLSGFPLQLASDLAGLPAGSGSVAGAFDTELPWPLPDDLAAHDLVLTFFAVSVDWVSDETGVGLRGVHGALTLERGAPHGALAGELRVDKSWPWLPATLSIGADGAARAVVGDTQRDDGEFADITTTVAPFIAAGNASGRSLPLSVQLRAGAVLLPRLTSLAGLPAGDGQLTARMQTQLPWPLPDALSWRDIDATVTGLGLRWASADGQLTVRDLGGSARTQQGKASATLRGSARLRVDDRAVDLSLPAASDFSYAEPMLRGGRGLRIALLDANNDAVATLRSFELNTGEKQSLTVDADTQLSRDAHGASGRVRGRVDVRSATPRDVTGRVAFDGTMRSAGLSEAVQMNANLGVRGDVFVAEGTLRQSASGGGAGLPVVLAPADFTLRHDLSRQSGRADIRFAADLRAPLLAGLQPAPASRYDLDAGQLSGAVTLQWQDPGTVAADLLLTLADGRAHFDDYLARGVAGRLRLLNDDLADATRWRMEPSPLRAARLDVGVSVNELATVLAYADGEVAVSRADATLLGGRAEAAPFRYRVGPGSAEFVLSLTGIDLAQVLALEGKDVAGSGTLDGTLPVSIDQGEVRISGGKVAARPPGGTLRLRRELAGVSGRPNLDFALRALADYAYTSLSTTLDYAPNGDLALGVATRGSNRAVEGGRPIHYNLNITENVPTLLRSLRLQDAVSDQVEKTLRKKP